MTDRRRVWLRAARLITIAVVAGVGIATLVWAVTDLHFNDLGSYQAAALRIRSGEQLYGGDVTPFTKYYYAPWFAYAFLPLSFLPWPLLAVIWTTFTVGCSLYATWPLVRIGTPEALVLAGMLGPILVALSFSGNVHAPMLALLVWALPTRWGPVALGVAASLKATPILLVIAYIGRRQFRHAVIAIATGAVLWAPVLLFDIAPITFESGGAALSTGTWLALGAAGAAGALVIAHRWPQYGLSASAVAVYLSTPRLYVYDMTILLVPPAAEKPRTSRQ